MKKSNGILLATLFFLITALSGCEVIGDIFKAGVWTGFIIVGLIVFLIIWLIAKSGGKK